MKSSRDLYLKKKIYGKKIKQTIVEFVNLKVPYTKS